MTLAMQLTKFLGGQWYQSYGTVACPVCQPERRRDQNALTLTDGGKGLLVHCKKSECDFRSIMMAVGMSEIRSRRIKPEKSDILAQREAVEFAASVRRAHWAMRTWHEAVPIRGTIAEAYLKSRGISCEMPTSLRYHAACWHGPTKKFYPAMVGLVEGCESTSIHRTFLRPDGSGQAPIKPSKLILGKAKGGAVCLTSDSDHLLVAEGIETALSLASGLLPTPMSIWAALSTSGVRGLELPRTPGLLTIASDGDAAGELAASVLAERAHASGWKVFMLPAPAGKDWNDVLREKGASQ